MTNKIRIGTRSSALAMWQTHFVRDLIHKVSPGTEVEIIQISTKGDRVLDRPLAAIGSFGLFTKELESSLLNNEIDVAVHSLKDLESALPDGLKLGAVPVREDHRDVLVARAKGMTLADIPDNGKILTGSLRRKAQLLNHKPGLIIEDVRGNVQTRMQKFFDSDADGLIMASAGLKRMEMDDKISSFLPDDILLPAVGQGALGIEIRSNDDFALEVCDAMNDSSLMKVLEAERSYLARIQGGCSIPVGGLAKFVDGKLVINGMLASLDGNIRINREVTGDIENRIDIGIKLAEEILSAGGQEILDSL